MSSLFSPVGEYKDKSGMEYCLTQYENASRDLGVFADHIDIEGALVLDAGCSYGGKTVYYAQQGPARVVGLERESQKLTVGRELAKEKKVENLEFLTGDISAMPFDDDMFDIIFLNDVVEHIPHEILFKALKECGRVVKPDGSICIEFPPWTGPYAAHVYDHIPIPWCHYIFSDETLVNVMESYQVEREYSDRNFREFYYELNRLDAKEFKQMAANLDLQFEYYNIRVPKNISILKQIPVLKEYMSMRVIAVLTSGN